MIHVQADRIREPSVPVTKVLHTLLCKFTRVDLERPNLARNTCGGEMFFQRVSHAPNHRRGTKAFPRMRNSNQILHIELDEREIFTGLTTPLPLI